MSKADTKYMTTTKLKDIKEDVARASTKSLMKRNSQSMLELNKESVNATVLYGINRDSAVGVPFYSIYNEKYMSDIIKFTEEELKSLAKLQSDYQEQIFKLGQIELERIDLTQKLQDTDTKRSQVLELWKKIQGDESNIVNGLSQKYGNGVLNVRDGTFTPKA